MIDNSRVGSRRFDVSVDSIMHGIAGYFDCLLYGDVSISKCSTSATQSLLIPQN